MSVPDIQVGPVGGILLWGVIALVIVGLLFAPTLGGAIVWGVFIIALALLLYFLVRRVMLRFSGRRGGR